MSPDLPDRERHRSKIDKFRIWNISRSELLGILLARAKELGATCKFNAGVADIDTEAEKPKLVIEGGETLSFDLVIASDGEL